MRISTNTIYELGSGRLSDLQARLVRTQQQLSTQRRILTPADDPVAAAAALAVTQSMSMNEQYGINRQNAKSALSEEESVLQGMTSLLQDMKTLIVNAGNGTLEDKQRQFLAAEIRGRFDELLGLANSRDGGGNYMFGGYQISSPPFSQTATGAQYNGDQGQRLLQVGPSRFIPLNDSGSAIFQMNKTGNGKFVTAADPANTGSGIVGSGAVTGVLPSTYDYSVEFSVDPNPTPGEPDVTTYMVKDNISGMYMDPATGNFDVPGPPPAAPAGPRVPYVSGEAIAFGGIQFDVKGAPAGGDSFTVKPSANQSIFTTLHDLVTTLTTGAPDAAGQARLANGLAAANNNVDNALDNLLEVRAAVGTRLKELDALDSSGADMQIQYVETLSKLQDIDLTETISNFTQQQITLEAAQKSFMAISKLSLFDLI